MNPLHEFAALFSNFGNIDPRMIVMWVVGGVLVYLAIKKEMEPTLLLPMGFGTILVNLPLSGAITQAGAEEGPISVLFDAGIANELFPLLLFIGIGAMIDFGPLLKNPWLMLFGAAAQFGIFFTFFVAGFFFDINVIKAVTSKKERLIRMKYHAGDVSKTTKIVFPIVVTAVAGLVAPKSVALVGFLMFGNLIRECGVLNQLSETAQNAFANIITILLGLTVAAKMHYQDFVSWQTLMILGLGLVAFIFDTVGGVMFGKFINLFLPKEKKINPMIGAAGISAFPMSGRVVNQMGLKEDPQNFLLMYSISVNVSGQIASVIAGGLILTLVS